MLISPPFLPPRATLTEDNWIQAAMTGDAAERGAFPVSLDLGWHGGLHLEAPAGATTSGNLDALAIADGTVVYFRKPRDKNDESTDPLNYAGGWTSDGCVVLRHETDIGEGDNAKVVFYSVTMHLNALSPKIKPNAKIYRKEELGQAGYIRGNANKIHIEIICDDTNLAKLIGRSNNTFNANGRTDAVYGEIYFKLPVGTSLYQNQPADNITTPVEAAAHVTTTPYIIGLRYSCGEAPPAINNVSAGKGGAILSTYQEDGTLIANGQISEPDSEYNLYKRAMAINKVYNDAHATVVPAPSAIYELLRFGRIINTANETLTPADTPHWRKVKYEGGEGWVNLNQTNIPVYSDADFPPWKGWLLVDDDTDGDSRCDSNILKQWLDVNGDGKVDHAEAERIISQDGIKSKLCKTICKLPTEWAKADTATRYQWLKAPNEIRPEVMSDEDFAKMTAHIEALGFWDEANIGIDATHWHFEPREFIRQFRMCGWLSRNELLQLLPMKSLRKAGSIWKWEPVSLPGASLVLAEGNADSLQRRLDLNKALRKFLVVTPIRLACFFGNATQETQWFSKFHEGSSYWYKPWDGRGFLQLTHAANYMKYWEFMGQPVNPTVKSSLIQHTALANTNRNATMNDPTHSLSDASTGVPQAVIQKRNSLEKSFEAANSACTYWAWADAARQADAYTNQLGSTIKTVTTDQGIRHYYENSAFGSVAATVNIGSPSTNFSAIWGVQARFMAFANAQVILMDVLKFIQSDNTYSELPQHFEFRRPS